MTAQEKYYALLQELYACNYTYGNVAHLLGVSRSYVCKMLKGDRVISAKIMQRIDEVKGMKKKDLRCCGNCVNKSIYSVSVEIPGYDDLKNAYALICFDSYTKFVISNHICDNWVYDKYIKDTRTVYAQDNN